MRVFQSGSQVMGDSNQQLDLPLRKAVRLGAAKIERADADIVADDRYADGRSNPLFVETIGFAVLELFRGSGVIRLLGFAGNFHDRPGSGNVHAFVKCSVDVLGVHIEERKGVRFGLIDGDAALDKTEDALELGIDYFKKPVSVQVQAGFTGDLIDHREPCSAFLGFTVQAGIENGGCCLVGDGREEEKIIVIVMAAVLEIL